MTDEEKQAVEAGADEAPADEAPADEAPDEELAPRVAEPFVDPLVEIRFVRQTKWCIGTADGPQEQVLEDGDVVEFPSSVAHVFVGLGAAVWSGDTETAVREAGEVATRSRRRRK